MGKLTKTGNTSPQKSSLSNTSSGQDIDSFLEKANTLSPITSQDGAKLSRMIIAMDATASREPTWRMAQRIQASMFQKAMSIAPLAVQLVYYRGFHECKAGSWLTSADALATLMGRVNCLAGETQIGRVLTHAANTARKTSGHARPRALVFIGDACEEPVDTLGRKAGELGLLNVPAFMFQEGADPIAERAFKQIATLTGGAYAQFNSNSPETLRALLTAVAIYSAGGKKALLSHELQHKKTPLLLSSQLK